MPEDLDLLPTAIGATTLRAAEALLRALGDGAITLRLPLPSAVVNADLGLAGPPTEEVDFSPAVLRVVEPLDGGMSRYEADLAAETVEEEVEKRNLESADALFASVLGIVKGGKLLRIVNVTPHACGATVYLYRVQAVG